MKIISRKGVIQMKISAGGRPVLLSGPHLLSGYIGSCIPLPSQC